MIVTEGDLHTKEGGAGVSSMEYDRVSLEDWQKQQPLSVLQLDTADRVVLRVAGISWIIFR